MVLKYAFCPKTWGFRFEVFECSDLFGVLGFGFKGLEA